MPLESCMICIDNSEFSRNGDYIPTRLGAQIDTTNMLQNVMINPPSHPESSIGILTMGQSGAKVRVSPTRDQTRLLTATSNMECGGVLKFCHGVKIAQLALKHRQNKAGEQRIIAIVCSPVEESEKDMKKLANFLRKEGINIDVVIMGDIEKNEDILTKFVGIVDKEGENSHVIVAPVGSVLSNVMRNSAVLGGGSSGGGAAGSDNNDGGDFGNYGGMDPNEDPEMAMVIQMSLMEERARQEAEAKESGETGGDTAGDSTAVPSIPELEMSEDDLIQQALALSEMENTEAYSTVPDSTVDAAPFTDPSFVSGLLSGLPGVDMSDPRILAAMQQMGGGSTEEGDESKTEEKKKTDEEKE